MELENAGFNASTHDCAKPSELYRLRGKMRGKRIISSDWVDALTIPDERNQMPRTHPLSGFSLGYG